MKIRLSQKQAIACRSMAEDVEERFGSTTAAREGLFARAALLIASSQPITKRSLLGLSHIGTIFGAAAAFISEDGTIIVKDSEAVTSDVLIGVTVDPGGFVNLVGWISAKEFAVLAKHARGRSKYLPTRDPRELFIDVSTKDAIAELPLVAFAKLDLALRIESPDVEPFWLISQESSRRHCEGDLAVWTASEALAMLRRSASPDSILAVHRFKKTFKGVVDRVDAKGA